jgi:hypothetical protein
VKVALAFIGGAAVAAVAFLLIEMPSERVPDPTPPQPPPATSMAFAPPAVVLPEPPKPEVKPKPVTPKVAPVAVAKVAPPPPPTPAPETIPEPAPSLAIAEFARITAPPKDPETPPAPPAPVVEKPEPPPLMKPDSLEVRRAKVERTPETVTIPAGTVLKVRLNQSLSSELNENGDSFSATLEEPLIVNGLVIAEKGTRLDGRVVDAVRAGRVKGVSKLSIRLLTLHTSDRQRVSIFTDEFVRDGKKGVGKDATRVAVGAGIGAAMGAIFGGGSGAAIGAATGGTMGAGSVLLTRGQAAELAVETRIPFRLRDDVTITENLN